VTLPMYQMGQEKSSAPDKALTNSTSFSFVERKPNPPGRRRIFFSYRGALRGSSGA
jgi:hypothetical protein